MRTFVINREDAQKSVEIFFPDSGKKDTVFIQPLSKARIPEGSQVSDEFLKLNPKIQVKTQA